jgi:RNA polymerase sigma factor for flagellar operon FliA
MDALVPWALRMGARIAARLDVAHCTDDMGGEALYALSRAVDAYDREEGELLHFAAAWISRHVRREARREKRHQGVEVLLGEGDETGGLPASLDVDEQAHEVLEALLDVSVGEELRMGGEAGVLRAEAFDALRRAIAELPVDDRRLVELRYWEDLSWPDVAVALGIGMRTAQEHHERIRERLRRTLLAWDRVRPMRRASP